MSNEAYVLLIILIVVLLWAGTTGERIIEDKNKTPMEKAWDDYIDGQ